MDAAKPHAIQARRAARKRREHETKRPARANSSATRLLCALGGFGVGGVSWIDLTWGSSSGQMRHTGARNGAVQGYIQVEL
eukprot:scaffold260996_cov33-Tisochrysis_lutea.AAC.4